MVIIGKRWGFLIALIEGTNQEAQRVFKELSGLIFECPDNTTPTYIPNMGKQESELDFGMWAELVNKNPDGKGMKEVLLALFYDMEPTEICLDMQCHGICCSKGLHIQVIRMVSTEVGIPVVPNVWPPLRPDHIELVDFLRPNIVRYTKFIDNVIQDRINYIVRHWPLLRKINKKETEIVHKLRGVLNDKTIMVHGSARSGLMHKNSDIDLITNIPPESVHNTLLKSGYNVCLIGGTQRPRVSVTVDETEFDITYIGNLYNRSPPPGIFDDALHLGISKFSTKDATILLRTISCVSHMIRELIARDECVNYKGVPSITIPLILLAIAQRYTKDFTSFNLIQDLTKIWSETSYTLIHFKVRKDGYVDIEKVIDCNISSRINVYYEDYKTWNMGLHFNKYRCKFMERATWDYFNLLTFRSISGIWELRTLPPSFSRPRAYCETVRVG